MYKIADCDTDQYNDGTRVQERYHLLKRINRQLTKQNILKQKTAGTRFIPWFLQNTNSDTKYFGKKKKAWKKTSIPETFKIFLISP